MHLKEVWLSKVIANLAKSCFCMISASLRYLKTLSPVPSDASSGIPEICFHASLVPENVYLIRPEFCYSLWINYMSKCCNFKISDTFSTAESFCTISSLIKVINRKSTVQLGRAGASLDGRGKGAELKTRNSSKGVSLSVTLKYAWDDPLLKRKVDFDSHFWRFQSMTGGPVVLSLWWSSILWPGNKRHTEESRDLRSHYHFQMPPLSDPKTPTRPHLLKVPQPLPSTKLGLKLEYTGFKGHLR